MFRRLRRCHRQALRPERLRRAAGPSAIAAITGEQIFVPTPGPTRCGLVGPLMLDEAWPLEKAALPLGGPVGATATALPPSHDNGFDDSW
jgi:hypothetical protein